MLVYALLILLVLWAVGFGTGVLAGSAVHLILLLVALLLVIEVAQRLPPLIKS